ncbi:PREDICTED: mitotic-spindle organizing protein 1-like [Elephantulus edwardii]|uniref:mitotic-spindle organizing protein 1-like n=1 Tax=Elephantulus edwardii TaxID=28737 RepID=UPI0003F0E6D7|nr:PREDICTED: mitotic-spindle organizing protein 1-like [Elephantulus edwardii]
MAGSGGAGAPGASANMNAAMDILLAISRNLNTGLDMETLSICVRLCEQGINPEALSLVFKELRKTAETLKVAENMAN